MTSNQSPASEGEFLVLARARVSFCHFLNLHFVSLPDKDFVHSLRSDEFFEALEGLKPDQDMHPEIGEGAATMGAYLKATIDLESEELAERLGEDRTQLYRGVAPNYGPPPPYEALWISKGRDVFEVLQEISTLYGEGGFSLREDNHERLDYLGIELDFFEQLIHWEISAWEAGDRDGARQALEHQEIFLREHLATWVPKFVAGAMEHVRTDFYRGHLRMLNGFMTEERKTLPRLIKSS